ncbi:hypothetical protein RN001_000244 [Aquatica leii]|uniref:Uncharacterized protein n=1 Tax=Aquatica leii TaxID=1421715 RepID=A0AAN7PF25_9COLE|nr:hypothetical protein RN001_000244 [Aquatica leii]
MSQNNEKYLIIHQIPMQFYFQETIFSVMQLLFSLNMNNYSAVSLKSIARNSVKDIKRENLENADFLNSLSTTLQSVGGKM